MSRLFDESELEVWIKIPWRGAVWCLRRRWKSSKSSKPWNSSANQFGYAKRGWFCTTALDARATEKELRYKKCEAIPMYCQVAFQLTLQHAVCVHMKRLSRNMRSLSNVLIPHFGFSQNETTHQFLQLQESWFSASTRKRLDVRAYLARLEIQIDHLNPVFSENALSS